MGYVRNPTMGMVFVLDNKPAMVVDDDVNKDAAWNRHVELIRLRKELASTVREWTHQEDKLKTRVAELETDNVKLQTEIDTIRLVNGTLEEELDDWKNSAKQAAEEDCLRGEKHCTCVPLLRKELSDARDLLRDILEDPESWWRDDVRALLGGE